MPSWASTVCFIFSSSSSTMVRQALPDGERTDSGAHWAEFRGVTLPE